jgi:hypothetical protein
MKSVSSPTISFMSFERSRLIGIGAFRKIADRVGSHLDVLGEPVVALTRGLVGRDGRHRPQFQGELVRRHVWVDSKPNL